MKKQSVKMVLLVEGNPGDARLLREMLNEQSSYDTELTQVGSMSEAEKHLAKHAVDIILLDLGLPDARGLDALRRAHTVAPRIPLVVLTGLHDESLAAQALQEGAQEHLVKGQTDARALLRALRYAVVRKAVEDALFVEKERAAVTLNCVGDAVISTDVGGNDVSMARALALKTSYLAQHDSLTDLPNRILFSDRLNQAMSLARRHRQKLAVLFVDVDRFKHINDSLGHAIGDRLLQSVAQRLLGCVRSSDTVSRQGGDEFLILLSQVAHGADAAVSAARILRALTAPYNIDRHDLHLTVSIGIVTYPGDGTDAETLMQNADSAVHDAKDHGRNNYQFFQPEMNVRTIERQSLENDVRHALERREFVLHYQPKMNLETGAITGVEALIRWRHPRRGLVPPAQFIPIAEESGVIVPVGRWVLGEACRQARAWQDAGLPSMRIAINISAVELRAKDFVGGVRSVLTETGLQPRCLELELTETLLMQDPTSTAVVLRGLKDMGVHLALDDFGTGYSSLSYLKRFPIDTLKIDQSFVRDLATNADDASIVSAVISMGKSLHMRVVAEGVETREQLAFLQEQHCPYGQGYYFGRPLAATECTQILGRRALPMRVEDDETDYEYQS